MVRNQARLVPFARGLRISIVRASASALCLLCLTACAATSSATLPYGSESYQPEPGSVQPGDLNHLSQGSLIW
jgi:hypothetical protein